MALQTQTLERSFRYNSIDLPDPGPQYTIEQVRDLYSATYPEIVSAGVDGPEEREGKLVYTFRRAVGTKGAEVGDATAAGQPAQWALVELFGHQRVAGLLTEATLGGCHFLRVDVPEIGDAPAFTRLYTQGAIYGITFVEERIARELARQFRVQPVQQYELRNLLSDKGAAGGEEDY